MKHEDIVRILKKRFNILFSQDYIHVVHWDRPFLNYLQNVHQRLFFALYHAAIISLMNMLKLIH